MTNDLLSIQTGDKEKYDPKSRSTFQVVAKMAYLLGVPKRHIENDQARHDVFIQLEQDKNARIVRNLCMLRTAIELNFKTIMDHMRFEYRSLMTIEEIPKEAIKQLTEDGISIIKSHMSLVEYVVQINKLISDRINNCKSIFPMWINWNYVRDVFIMPNGLSEEGAKAAAATYYEYKSYYPYQVYMNWPPSDEGNILYNDRKFLCLLYEWNGDKFTDFSKVSDASNITKGRICDFLEQSQRTVMVVDCENSDPYKLCAVLRGLSYDAVEKISKIILYSDSHAASGWGIFELYTDVPIEYMQIERVKGDKSLVDTRLITGACKEHYVNQADSFLLVSSDSDYWGLISSLEHVNFLVMVERDKCGSDIKRKFIEHDIFYCYIDDFYSGDDSYQIKVNAMVRAIRTYLSDHVHLNVNDILKSAYRTTRADMTDAEEEQFYNTYIKPMHIKIEENGDVSILLRD